MLPAIKQSDCWLRAAGSRQLELALDDSYAEDSYTKKRDPYCRLTVYMLFALNVQVISAHWA